MIIPSLRSELVEDASRAPDALRAGAARSLAASSTIVALAASAAIGGTAVAIHYYRLGLTLSHYDARGHLVVARRIIDNLTPGWQQIGAVWLPLPHLLNALPVQIDSWYRSGASAVAISIAAFALAVAAIARMVLQLTGSRAAAATAAAAFALNANVLYLASTPLTEPLLIGLTTLAVALLLDWTAVARGTGPRPSSRVIGTVFALACLTRYEAWPVTAGAVGAAVWARWRRGETLTTSLRSVARIAWFPIAAILAFLVFSRVVIGVWLVPSGFFVPENAAQGRPLASAAEIWYGLHALSGPPLAAIGAAGVVAIAVRAMRRDRSDGLIVLSLAAAAAVPWVAFFEGHPFRIRYMVPLIPLLAVGVGFIAGLAARVHIAGAALVLTVIGIQARPLDSLAPMVVEAQWDRPNVPIRAQVTACLGAPGAGGTIMASMGSLGHYMQEASHAGFALRDFLHEGNGDIWLAALAFGPRPFAEWVLIEEKAEGGDMLAAIVREHPRFLDGYSRICEGAGLVLYRRIKA